MHQPYRLRTNDAHVNIGCHPITIWGNHQICCMFFFGKLMIIYSPEYYLKRSQKMISFHSHKFKRNVYCFARFCSSNHSLCYIRIYCRHIIIHRFVPSFLLYYGPGKYTSSYTRHFSSARRYCFYLLIVNISCLQLIVQLC